MDAISKKQTLENIFCTSKNTCESQPCNDGVYVLELRNPGHYYVGYSQDISKRVKEHESGGKMCAAFVKANGGVLKRHEPDTARNEEFTTWEQQETLTQMIKHGFNKVRGWAFTRVKPLDPNDLHTIRTVIFESGDVCRKCGKPDHFVKNCPSMPREKMQWLIDLETLITEQNPQASDRSYKNAVRNAMRQSEK